MQQKNGPAPLAGLDPTAAGAKHYCCMTLLAAEVAFLFLSFCMASEALFLLVPESVCLRVARSTANSELRGGCCTTRREEDPRFTIAQSQTSRSGSPRRKKKQETWAGKATKCLYYSNSLTWTTA